MYAATVLVHTQLQESCIHMMDDLTRSFTLCIGRSCTCSTCVVHVREFVNNHVHFTLYTPNIMTCVSISIQHGTENINIRIYINIIIVTDTIIYSAYTLDSERDNTTTLHNIYIPYILPLDSVAL